MPDIEMINPGTPVAGPYNPGIKAGSLIFVSGQGSAQSDEDIKSQTLSTLNKIKKIVEAGGGKEGLEMAEKHMPDCILLDLLMPEMDGFDVLEALGEKDLKIPVIVLTANIQKTAREKCLQLGAFAFTNKPTEEDELRSLVHKAIDSKKGAD